MCLKASRNHLQLAQAAPGNARQGPGVAMPFSGDTVGSWEVTLSDGVHEVEFEHGTTTGKRVIRVDGQEILRRDWMFKLVGPEVFTLGKSAARCVIKVEPVGGFSYSYELQVNGKNYHKFNETQSRAMKTWLVKLPSDEQFRVVLEKDTLDIWANGQKLEATGEFVDDGTETHFSLGSWPAYIKAVSSGKRREGLIHTLVVNDSVIPESID